MNKGKATLTRDNILIEACRLVEREGITHLTLEKVAKEAGVSKGGLLYHFPSKDELIKGMIDDMIKRSYRDIDKHLPTGENPPGEWLRAFVRTTFDEVGRKDLMSPGLLAVLLSNPDLVDTWRNAYSDWAQKIEDDNNDLIIATIVRLALEGLWFTDLLGFSPLEGEFREKVQDALIELSRKHSL